MVSPGRSGMPPVMTRRGSPPVCASIVVIRRQSVGGFQAGVFIGSCLVRVTAIFCAAALLFARNSGEVILQRSGTGQPASRRAINPVLAQEKEMQPENTPNTETVWKPANTPHGRGSVKSPNTPHGSVGIVHTQPTKQDAADPSSPIPAGGERRWKWEVRFFASRLSLNQPPTAVGGIWEEREAARW